MIQALPHRNSHQNSRLKVVLEVPIVDEEQVNGWKNQSPTNEALPNHYKYLTLDPQLKQKKQTSLKVIPQIRVKRQSEENATTVLLSQSQKDDELSTKKVQNMMRTPNYLKMTEASAQKISPFTDKQELQLEQQLINNKQRQKIKTECAKYSTSPRRYMPFPFHKSFLPQKEQKQYDCVKVSQVHINAPAFDHPFPPENCFYGTRLWKKAMAVGNKQRCSRGNIRKSVSLSLCQITHKQDVKESALSIAIKKLAPMGKARSTSLPLRIQHKIESFINSPSKRMKQHNKKDMSKAKPKLRRMDSILMAPPRQRQTTEPLQTQQKQTNSRSSKFNISNIFRRLNAFKKKYPALQAYDLQPKYRDLSINCPKSQGCKQFGNRLVQMRYKLMKKGFKLRRTASLLQAQSQNIK